jgi:hypothetical protein
VGEGVPPRFWVCCLRSVVRFPSEGSSAASLLELSGTMKWSVLFLCLWTGRC